MKVIDARRNLLVINYIDGHLGIHLGKGKVNCKIKFAVSSHNPEFDICVDVDGDLRTVLNNSVVVELEYVELHIDWQALSIILFYSREGQVEPPSCHV